jgi:DNA-binding CsgD family transcriptional regulator
VVVAPVALGREDELTQIGRVLDRGTTDPAYLCITGEAGIGKTTLLDAARRAAFDRSFSVFSCAPSSVESQMSYAGLTDLLAPMADHLDELPEPQRLALEAALLRRTRVGRPPDIHTVGAGTRSLLAFQCARGPVLLAVDDVQWLDEPSLRALTYAIRRCRAPYALVLTLREGHDLPLRGVLGFEQVGEIMRLEGLHLAPLHQFLARSGHVLDLPAIRRIAAVSRGNPLFARELARASTGKGLSLPSDLSAGMRSRLLVLSTPARAALLVASAIAEPRAATLREAGVDHPATDLAEAEAEGIVSWHGDHLIFGHPLWREIAYQAASPQDRRAVHSRLSETTLDVEERARHLALSSPLLEASTVAALEDAATSARLRGAPSYAAELLGLALVRGNAEPALVLQAAHDHFVSGATEQARMLAHRVLELNASRSVRAGALNLLGEITYFSEDFPQAVAYLERAYDEAAGDPLVRAGAAIDLAFASANLGMNRVGLDWASRAEADAALAGDTAVAAEAAGSAAVLAFLCGEGIDHHRLDAALANEDVDRPSPPFRWPSMSAALVLLWGGDLTRARPALAAVRRRYGERGLDSGLSLLLARQAEAALLDGDVVEAASLVAEIDERARIAGGEAESVLALAWRVVLAAYRGDLQRAVGEHRDLLAFTHGTEHLLPGLVAMAALGMCHLSNDEPDAAADLLEPVADLVLALGLGEPVISPFFADSVEALTAMGRADRAVPLVEMLETWGHRSGSIWATGVAARGRAILLLDAGDLDGAEAALRRALDALDVRSHRYERARTQLVRAAVHRRRRQRVQAREVLVAARDQFASLGASGWQAYTDREIKRLGLRTSDTRELTPSERRIATLAASGLTNIAVATRLSISPKTVEAHLTHIYGKLGIHTRAELGQWVVRSPGD